VLTTGMIELLLPKSGAEYIYAYLGDMTIEKAGAL